MEAFSSLKFWRDSGTGFQNNNIDVRNRAPESYDEDEDYDDESFFDLVFTKASDAEEKSVQKNVAIDLSGEYLTIECPFKSKTAGFTGKPQSPISFLSVVPKFRVLLLGFKKSKSARTSPVNEASAANQKHQLHESHGSVQSNKFAVEEVQISSLLQRECDSDLVQLGDSSRRLPNDFLKYLKLIKPLYVHASKRYFESPRISSDLSSTDSPCSSPATAVSRLPTKSSEKRSAGFGVLTKHLKKSRSVSSMTTSSSPPVSRRDDSLFLQNDGIHSAILHCKQSLNNTSAQEYSSSGKRQQVV